MRFDPALRAGGRVWGVGVGAGVDVDVGVGVGVSVSVSASVFMKTVSTDR